MARERIEINPDVMGGKRVIRGPKEILTDHPKLTLYDIRAARNFAADYLADEEIVYR